MSSATKCRRIALIFLFCGISSQSSAQSDSFFWSQVELAKIEAKLFQREPRFEKYFEFGIYSKLVSSSSLSGSFVISDAIVQNNESFKQSIRANTGDEVLIGGLSDFDQNKNHTEFGLKVGYQFSERFCTDWQIGFWQNSYTAYIPLTVLSSGTSGPKTIRPALLADLRGLSQSLGITYYQFSGAIRPFLRLAVHASSIAHKNFRLMLEEVEIQNGQTQEEFLLGFQMAFGLRTALSKNIALDLSGQLINISGQNYKVVRMPAAMISLVYSQK